MATALSVLSFNMERARRRGDASTLAILQMLSSDGQTRPTDLAKALGVHQSSVTRTVRSLEEAGQVELTMDPHDRRSCLVELSEHGWAEVQRLTSVGIDRFTTFVADWSAGEVRELARLANKFIASAEAATRRASAPTGRHWQQQPSPAKAG